MEAIAEKPKTKAKPTGEEILRLKYGHYKIAHVFDNCYRCTLWGKNAEGNPCIVSSAFVTVLSDRIIEG
jgi:hypothetical protein